MGRGIMDNAIERVKKEFNDAIDRVGEGSSSALDKLAETSDALTDALRREVHEAGDRLDEAREAFFARRNAAAARRHEDSE